MSDAGAPRIAPLPRERWDDAVLGALRAAFPEPVVQRFLSVEGAATVVPNAIATLLHHPVLAGPWLAYNNVLLRTPALDHRLRELIVLRVARRTRSTYEWVQHVMLADRFGVTAEDIGAIAHVDAERWTPLEAALLAATDQLIERHRIDDDTWRILADHLDDRQLVEMVFVVGTYTCLAMAFNTFGILLEPGLPRDVAPKLPD